MSGPIPHTTPSNWPELRADRFASTISVDSPEGCRVALIGLPDDTGVALNHGRLGAAGGPRAFRAALAAYGTHWDTQEMREIPVRVYDAGDVEVVKAPRPAIAEQAGAGAPPPDAASVREQMEQALRATHDRITEAVCAAHEMGMIPVCVGGGHDLTLPTVRSLAQSAGAPVGGLNVDAHLDVRDTVGSGMPFRALIEGGYVDAERFVVFGAGRFANAREHVRWLTDRGGTIIGVEKAIEHRAAMNVAFERISRGLSEPAFVSVDLDSIDSGHAPGVSAVCPMGLSVPDVVRIADRAGRTPSVRHFDIMELCPPHDEPPGPGRTARVAALLFLTFIAAVAERPS